MTQGRTELIGFSCAYTPVSIIRAAGYTPYRILPLGDSPDRSGQFLHDNLCSHVKGILNRAMAKDLPELSGTVFINCCDAMRRLADAWKTARPCDRTVLIELPCVCNDLSVSFLAKEFSRFAQTLSKWSKKSVREEKIKESIELYNELDAHLGSLRDKVGKGLIKKGGARLQEAYNLACTKPVEQAISATKNILREQESPVQMQNKVPVYLFGNVMPDPYVFELFESWGVLIIDDDLCTGSRSVNTVELDGSDNLFLALAKGAYLRPPCARTFDTSSPMGLAQKVVARAKACKARGVIGYTLKFCDPYLARLPTISEVLQEASIPLLLIEGDCTRGSIGQQQTRVEAFVEMLG
jgi:benzoyl-CoA reductase/2-hydroxyglutaryl-CoA dehydratase subunit BcrC/BadD/HgdB